MFKDHSDNWKLKVAFDYDGTLTDPSMFELAQRLIRRGHDVWILTARSNYEDYIRGGLQEYIEAGLLEKNLDMINLDLIETAKELGIENKIIYTNCDDKTEYFFTHKFDLLFDDDSEWHCNPICELGGVAVNI
jgi:hypothetical protein